MTPRRLLLALLLALAPAEMAHATDVSGLWLVSTTIRQAPVVMDCSLLQIGVALSGWCEPQTANAVPTALTGQLDRTQATWAYDVSVNGQTVHLAYSGTLTSGTAMTGNLEVAGASAPFTAARK